MLKRKPRSKSDGDTKRGVLLSIRQLLLSRRPFQRLTIRPAGEQRLVNAPLATHSISPDIVPKLSPGERAPAPPHDSSAESSQEEDLRPIEDYLQHGVRNDTTRDQKENAKTATKKSKKKTSTGWVPKLLNQEIPHRDRIPARGKRKHRIVERLRGCHPMLCVVGDPYSSLLARVFDFLEQLAPIRSCLTVNKAMNDSVAKYYSTFCDWPRPQAYLMHKLLSSHNQPLLARVLALLPMAERVRASATCHSFRRVVDSLPLELTSATFASQFLGRISSSRIENRFVDTVSIRCDSVVPADAIRLLRLISDDDGDHFHAVQEISLVRLSPFDSDAQFIALVQALFSDRISKSLRSLVLSDLSLDDSHFRHLSRLFYDGQFPHLQEINLSKNLFSSRFMRDMARSFREERFLGLQSLDVSSVGMGIEDMSRFFASLRFVPRLRVLRFSYNFCSVENLSTLAQILQEGFLVNLEEVSGSAISATDHGLALVLNALALPGVSSKLCYLDVSGNDLSDGDQTMRWISSALLSGSWPKLRHLNLSFSKPSHAGVQFLAHGLAQCASPLLSEIHLSGNRLCAEAFESLIHAFESRHVRNLQVLDMSDNILGPVEFEALANCLSNNSCPRLQDLLLSGNRGNADCMIHLRRLLVGSAAAKLYKLDLSGNLFPPQSLAFLAGELSRGSLVQLRILNVSRNRELPSVLRYQQLIRSNKCPSIACLQVGYAQTEIQGYAFVRSVRSRMSVEELRRLKQMRFEACMQRIEDENVAKAAQAAERCKRQTKLLREMYDHMENQADRALRRRKRVRKSPHLHIHEEIQRLKQEKYHDKVCRTLARALESASTV